MRNAVRAVLVVITMALIVSVSGILSKLPSPPESITKEKYYKWSGVLRLWACEGWECGIGSLAGWLNDSSARFERAHDGVYVQITYVSENTIKAFEYISDNPPDLILTSVGMLGSADGLLITDISGSLRTELRGYGEGALTPVAMGGYAWCINTRARQDGGLNGARVLLRDDGNYECASAALLALLVGDEARTGAQESRYGVDLGLPSPTGEQIIRESAGEREEIRLSLDSRRHTNAYTEFARGAADAIVVTQSDIKRLERLSNSGRAPDWKVVTTGLAFTDQLALLGIVDTEGADAKERQSASAEFVEYLLSDSRQSALASAGAFRVTDGAPLYASGNALAELEAFLIKNELIFPNAFDSRFRSAAPNLAESALSVAGSALEKFNSLFWR